VKGNTNDKLSGFWLKVALKKQEVSTTECTMRRPEHQGGAVWLMWFELALLAKRRERSQLPKLWVRRIEVHCLAGHTGHMNSRSIELLRFITGFALPHRTPKRSCSALFLLLLTTSPLGFGTCNAQSSGGAAPFGEGTIWTVAQEGDLSKVKMLLAQNPKLVNALYVINKGTPEQDDWTPLSLAAMAGNIDVVRYLLSKGAAANLRRSNGSPPLQDVVLWGNPSKNQLAILSLLISKGADVKRGNSGGLTPLHYTTDVEVARLLLSKGANINDHNNKYGITPLQALVKYEQRDLLRQGKIEIMLSLIRLQAQHHANLRYRDKTGKSVLDYTSRIRSPIYREKVTALLKRLGAK
jgi:hypothetical protein